MQTSDIRPHRHGLLIAACCLGALIAQAAVAGCPPGYLDKAGHCIPGPARSHPPYVAKSFAHTPDAVPLHASSPHNVAPMMIDKSKVKPRPGVPIEHHASASTPHGIIFVGGKQALNTQPIQPGKSSLNPQPIPPGHAVKVMPHPGAPVEQPIGH